MNYLQRSFFTILRAFRFKLEQKTNSNKFMFYKKQATKTKLGSYSNFFSDIKNNDNVVSVVNW